MKESSMPRTVAVTRYITPLREGGSLPALVDADDGFKYVLKFKGAGHGSKALIAELLGGEIARKLGLKVPELVFAHLDASFGRTEADEEIQDLLQGSVGLNLGLHFLSGALTYDPVAKHIDPMLASKIVWLDAFITNVDRTFRNTNMLWWHSELWLIDQGAAFYFHHAFTNWERAAMNPFSLIKEHVLLSHASELEVVDQEFRQLLSSQFFREIVALIPEDWLLWEGSEWSPNEIREIYISFLSLRLQHSNLFVNEAKNSRDALV